MQKVQGRNPGRRAILPLVRDEAGKAQSCRHTTATIHAVDEHTPPQVLQKIMRWSSTKMMDRYVHPDDSDAHEAANTMKRPDRDPENCV